MKIKNLLFVATMLIFSNSVMALNLINNGSFENGDYSGGDYETVSPGDTDITSWVVGGAGVDWHNDGEMKFPNDGLLVVDLNRSGGGLGDTGTMSQTFSTVAGKQYLLSFFLAGPDGDSFPDPRQVQVNIAGLTQVFSTPASSHDALSWEQKQLQFTAASTSTTLMFSSVDGTGFWGPLLDNVSVDETIQSVDTTATAIPAIGFIGMALLSGMLLIIGFSTYKRTKKT